MTRARDLAAFVSNADGDIKFDTDTLFIDSSTNRVGLGTSAPSVQLDIESTAPTIRLTDSDASGTPESEVSGAGGDITIRADRDNEKASSLIGFEIDGTERMRIADDGDVAIGTTAPDGKLHVYNGMLQVGSKDGDTSVQQNTNAIRIAAVPNTSTEWGGLQWYREFSNYIGAEIIAARPSSAEADTDLIFKTSSTSANATERMRLSHEGTLTVEGAVDCEEIKYEQHNTGSDANSGLNIIARYAFDNNSANSIGSDFNNKHHRLYIESGGGMSAIECIPNGGSGVSWQVYLFDPDDAVFRLRTVNFTQVGGDTFQVAVSAGGGSATIQRTGGSSAYVVYVSRVSGGGA